MDNDALNAIAALMSALAAFAALAVALMSHHQSKKASEVAQRISANAMDLTLQTRLDPMYPDLRRVLGHLDDGVPQEIRNVLIPFFVLYSDAFAAHRDGLLDERDWTGFRLELTYWSQKPTARRAWSHFRKQTWTEGFVEHVDSTINGPKAYPSLDEKIVKPVVEWPDPPKG